MKINNYKYLCKVFDSVLEQTSLIEIVANNYLHIINAHPQSLKKYSLSLKLNLLLFFRSKFIIIFRLIQSIFKNTVHKPAETDILFVSHLTNISQHSHEDDAYFGNLPKILNNNKIKNGIALINHIKVNCKPKNYRKTNFTSRYILDTNLRFISELKLIKSQIKSKKKLKKKLKDLKIDRLLSKEILNYHHSPDTYNAIRIAKQVADIAKKSNAKCVITTYEGHAWERLVYQCVRKNNPSIMCYGYQHAAISKYHHSINKSLQDQFNPDIIFTSGLITKRFLKKNKRIKSKIICLGSFKQLHQKIQKNVRKCCLVVPEGIFSECISLFKFSYDYALEHKNQKFIWRLHPILNLKILKNKISFFKNLPKNIIISEEKLNDDIKKCDYVLYRGSTSVLSAISAGLSPIYYKRFRNELSIDPIYEVLEGKFIVSNIIELHKSLNTKVSIKQKIKLQKFSINYFTPININSLLKSV